MDFNKLLVKVFMYIFSGFVWFYLNDLFYYLFFVIFLISTATSVKWIFLHDLFTFLTLNHKNLQFKQCHADFK